MKLARVNIAINYKAIIAFLVMTVIAVFSGLVASTGSLQLTQLVVGMIGGIALLIIPRWSIWIILSVGLLYGIFASYIPALNKLPWALALMSMLLMLPAIIRFIEAKNIPSFIWVALIFMVYALLVTLIQWDSFSQLIAGYKRYFQMYGLMFALALLAFKPEDYEKWLKLILFIALLQLPVTLIQRFMLGDLDGGYASAEITDRVAGTLGSSAEGGSSSAQMVTFLMMTAAFLIARCKEGLIEKSITFYLCLICLIPLGLGETKIVILLLPVAWLILMRDDLKKNLSRYMGQMFGLLALISIFAVIYIGLNKGKNDITSTEVLTQTLAYNIGEQGYGSYLLNRATVMDFWWANHSANDMLGMWFGHGMGSSYFNAGNAVAGHIAVGYIGYGIDLTSASTLLWDTGILGLILFISVFITAWRAAGNLRKVSTSSSVRADSLAIQACLAMLFVFIFYDNTLVNILSFELIFSAILGYLGYLVHFHKGLQQRETGHIF
jgi:hypothetical protein